MCVIKKNFIFDTLMEHLLKFSDSPVHQINQCLHCSCFATSHCHLHHIMTIKDEIGNLHQTLCRKQAQSTWSGSAGKVLQSFANIGQEGRRTHRSTGITTNLLPSC